MRMTPIDAAEKCSRGHQKDTSGEVGTAVRMVGQLLFAGLQAPESFGNRIFDRLSGQMSKESKAPRIAHAGQDKVRKASCQQMNGRVFDGVMLSGLLEDCGKGPKHTRLRLQ